MVKDTNTFERAVTRHYQEGEDNRQGKGQPQIPVEHQPGSESHRVVFVEEKRDKADARGEAQLGGFIGLGQNDRPDQIIERMGPPANISGDIQHKLVASVFPAEKLERPGEPSGNDGTHRGHGASPSPIHKSHSGCRSLPQDPRPIQQRSLLLSRMV